MATGNIKISIKLSLNGLRSRRNDASEIKVNCIIPDCTVKQKTFRVMARHFNEKHTQTSYKVLGIQCDHCQWSCHNNLRCFTVHMQQKHDLTVYMDTPINLKAVKKTKFSNHTAICSAMIAESHALNKEKKAEEKAVVKAAKKEAKLALKGKKNIPEEILLSEHAVDAENITVTINEEPVGESFDNFLDGMVVEMREIESQPSLDVENVTAEKPENITSTSTTEDMSGYDSDDIEYDSDDIQCLSDMESDDDNSVDSPVKVKTTKAFIEKVNENKRKLNLSVEIVMDSKKRKLSF
jgi:hypothetical protein